MRKTTLLVTLTTTTIVVISAYLFLANHLKIDPENPETYHNCILSDNCKIVESSRACLEVEAINKKISNEVWKDFLENKVPRTYDKCPRAELNTNNTKPVCRFGNCLAVEK